MTDDVNVLLRPLPFNEGDRYCYMRDLDVIVKQQKRIVKVLNV